LVKATIPLVILETPLGCASVTHLVGQSGSDTCLSRGIVAHHAANQAPFGVVGLNHRTASLETRSRVALNAEAQVAFLRQALEQGLSECIVLSTCNRTEVYFVGGSREIVIDMLAERGGMTPNELRPSLYTKSCVCAACHMFRVVAGLDSAVLGETEIVAQVKEAWRTAQEAGFSGPTLDLLFQRGLEVGKRIRTETDLCRTVTSTATLAVREAARLTGGLTDANIVVLGAGKIADRLVRELKSEGAKNVTILNRTVERAVELSQRLLGKPAGLDQLIPALAEADVCFATLATEHALLDSEVIADVAAARTSGRLLVIDMGVPPNVDARVDRANLDVVRLDDLMAACEANVGQRAQAIPAAMGILEEELGRLASALTERAAAPTIRALVEHGDSIRQRNLDWARGRLGHLDEKEMRVVEEMARRMMIGLLQAPIDSLKTELAAREHREVVEKLFSLDGGSRDL